MVGDVQDPTEQVLFKLQADENQPGARPESESEDSASDALAGGDTPENAAQDPVESSGLLDGRISFDGDGPLIDGLTNSTVTIGVVGFFLFLALIFLLMMRGRTQRASAIANEGIFEPAGEDAQIAFDGDAPEEAVIVDISDAASRRSSKSDSQSSDDHHDTDSNLDEAQVEIIHEAPKRDEVVDYAEEEEYVLSAGERRTGFFQSRQPSTPTADNDATPIREAFDSSYDAARQRAEQEAAEIREQAEREAAADREAARREAEEIRRDARRRSEEEAARIAERDRRFGVPQNEDTLHELNGRLNELAQQNASMMNLAESVNANIESRLDAAVTALTRRIDTHLQDTDGVVERVALAAKDRIDVEETSQMLIGVEDALVAQSEGIKADTRNILDALAKRLESRLPAALSNAQLPSGLMATDGMAKSEDLQSLSDRLAEVMAMQETRLDARLDAFEKRLGSLATSPAGAPVEIAALRKDLSALRTALGQRLTAATSSRTQLSDVLSQTLPRTSYELNVTLAEGGKADAAVRIGPDRPIAIDASFPVSAFNRLYTSDGVADDTEFATNEFRRTALSHVVSAAERLVGRSDTADFAFLFLPSDMLQAELHTRFPDVAEDAQRARLWIVGPTTLATSLNAARALNQATSAPQTSEPKQEAAGPAIASTGNTNAPHLHQRSENVSARPLSAIHVGAVPPNAKTSKESDKAAATKRAEHSFFALHSPTPKDKPKNTDKDGPAEEDNGDRGDL